MDWVLLCDFDGTIVEADTALYLLTEFAEGDWRKVISKYVRGEISLQECMSIQYSMLKSSKSLMLKKLEENIGFRSNFEKLIEYCDSVDIPFIIVSAGLDFVIKHFLGKIGLENTLETYTAKTSYDRGEMKLTFPELLYADSVNFKEDLLKRYRKEGFRVIYMGDGVSDYPAAEAADLLYTIKDSRLAQMCSEAGIRHTEIFDFQEVIDSLKKHVQGERKGQHYNVKNN